MILSLLLTFMSFAALIFWVYYTLKNMIHDLMDLDLPTINVSIDELKKDLLVQKKEVEKLKKEKEEMLSKLLEMQNNLNDLFLKRGRKKV